MRVMEPFLLRYPHASRCTSSQRSPCRSLSQSQAHLYSINGHSSQGQKREEKREIAEDTKKLFLITGFRVVHTHRSEDFELRVIEPNFRERLN